jgi:hypothetical protein
MNKNNKFINTTIRNKSKNERLNKEHIVPTQNVKSQKVILFLEKLKEIKATKDEILFSVGIELTKNNVNVAYKKFISEYSHKLIVLPDVPKNEFDLLGSVYQFLNTKLENLTKGSFYTGYNIAKDFVNDLDFSNGQVIFDPACGSGAFLFNSSATSEQIFGVDFDSTAVMIAKFNYFIKFPNANYPNIFHQDFFEWSNKNNNMLFDYIIGNPPYGANINPENIVSSPIISGESFSYFIEYSYKHLKNDGLFRFLLPESILNVKRHTDIRDYILEKTNLNRIKKYTSKFSGVMSDTYMIELNKLNTNDMTFINGTTTIIPKYMFQELKNHIFVHLTDTDISIIKKANQLKKYDLSKSIFGLGIVTGDNKTKLFNEKRSGTEHIYTGKEIDKYSLGDPKQYLYYDRSNLQQVAPDEIYRAKEKIVYKTICKNLKVAVDESGSLTSNSANIVIPKIKNMDAYVVMAFLNSNLYSYLHSKMFGGVNKIAKENLMSLPFPEVTKKQSQEIRNLTVDAITTKDDNAVQDYIHFNIFNLSKYETDYINSSV